MQTILERIKLRYIIIGFVAASGIGAAINITFSENNVSTPIALILWFLFSFFHIFRICRKEDYSFGIHMKPVKFQPIRELMLPIIMPQLLNLGILFLLAAVLLNIPAEAGASDPSTTEVAWNPIIEFLLLVVFAPFFEEVIFRWYLFNKLSIKVSLIKAMIISSLIFGILHGVESAIPTAISGTIWCILFVKYKSLFPCIIIHFLNNTMAFFLKLYSRQAVDSSVTETPDAGFIFVLSIILIAISLIWFVSFWKKNKSHIVHYASKLRQPILSVYSGDGLTLGIRRGHND